MPCPLLEPCPKGDAPPKTASLSLSSIPPVKCLAPAILPLCLLRGQSHPVQKSQYFHRWLWGFNSLSVHGCAGRQSLLSPIFRAPLAAQPHLRLRRVLVPGWALELSKHSRDLFICPQALRPEEMRRSLSLTSCTLQAIKLHPVIPALSSVICLAEAYLWERLPAPM